MRRGRRFGAALLFVCLLPLAARAQPERGREDGASGEPSRPGRRVVNVFISPAGEPFRAAPGEPYPSAVWFAGADADHDGRLTRAEFLADAKRFFERLDENHDGVIDGFELQDYEAKVAPEINPEIEGLRFGEGMDLGLGKDEAGAPNIGRGPQDGGRPLAGDRRPEGAGLFSFLDEPEPVAAADRRFDSRITLDEFLDVNSRRFDALDVKRQGYLVLSELPKTPVQTLKKRPLQPTRLNPRRGGPPI